MALDWLPDLFKGEAPVLFLGAGPSIAQGGPSWEKLGDLVAKATGIDSATLPVVASRLVAKQRRGDLEREVARELEKLPPSHDLADLLSLPWQAVFTTNYDLAPETLQSMHLPRPAVVYDDGKTHPEADRGTLPIYKLMGSTTKRYPERGHMLLSKTEINSPNPTRLAYLEILKEFLPTSPVLVVGSSLDDWVLLGTLEQATQLYGTNSRKRLVLVSPHQPKDEVWDVAQDFGLEWHEGDTSKVAASLRGKTPQAVSGRGRVVRVGSKSVELRPTVVMQELAGGAIIDSDHRGAGFKSQAEFYRLSRYSKQAFANKWDFPRDINVTQRRAVTAIAGALSTRDAIATLQELRKTNLCPSVAMLGSPGSAKTMTALRICHDWCAAGGVAVYVDATRLLLGFEPTAGLIRDLTEDLRNAGIERDPAFGGLLVVLDNAANSRNAVSAFRKQLLRDGQSDATILVTGQERDCPPGRGRDQYEQVWALSPGVSSSERERFVKFALATIPDVTTTIVDDALRHVDADSFFDLLYALVAPAREPLDKSVIRNIDGMTQTERELITAVAAFHHADIPFYVNLAALRWPDAYVRTSIIDEIEQGNLRQILARHVVAGVEVIKCPSDKQADIIFNAKIKDAARRLADVLLNFIPLVHHNDDEQRLFQDAVIEAARKKTRRRDIRVTEAEEIFRVAAISHPTRPFLQHYGMVLRELRDFPGAEAYLRRAIDTYDRKQGPEVVHHSLGELYYHWGKSLVATDIPAADAKYLLARDSYNRAKTGAPEFAQHGLAKLAIARAEICSDTEARRKLLFEALNLSYSGLLLAADSDQREYFQKTRGQARDRIARDAVTQSDAQRLSRELADATPFAYLAERIHGDRDLTEISQSELSSSLSIIDEGLTFEKQNPRLRYMRVRMRYILDPADPAILHLINELAGAVWPQEVARLRARSLAAMGDFKDAFREIQRADLVGTNLEARTEIRPEDLVRDKQGIRTWVVESHGGAPFIRLVGALQHDTPGIEPGSRVALGALYGHFVSVVQHPPPKIESGLPKPLS